MARAVWHDQPDYYSTATLPRFWTVAHADAIVSAGNGYGGGAALSGSSAAAYVITQSTGVDSSSEFGIGHRLKIASYPAAETVILGIIATGGDLPANMHVCATLRTDGKVSLWRGNLETLLATSAEALPTGSQLPLGLTGILDRHNGSAEVWVNRDVLVRVNTADTAGGDLGAIWGGLYVGLAPTLYASHLYAQAGSGDLRPGYVVRVLRPTVAQLTGYDPNTGTIPECLDDVDADDDTTYVSATGLDQRYAVEHDAVSAPRILGARTVALVRNVSGSSPSFTPFVRNGTTQELDVGSWRSVVSTEWRAIDRWYQRSPFTHASWTDAEITAAGWGGQTEV